MAPKQHQIQLDNETCVVGDIEILIGAGDTKRERQTTDFIATDLETNNFAFSSSARNLGRAVTMLPPPSCLVFDMAAQDACDERIDARSDQMSF